MFGLLLSAVILVVLLNVINDQEVEFLDTLWAAGIATLGLFALVIGLTILLGNAGVVVGGILSPVLFGFAVSYFFDVEIKRALLIGVLFVGSHFAFKFFVGLLSSTWY